MHAALRTLLTCIDLEEKEQVNRFRLDDTHSLKQLKAEGLALHPLVITRKSFGYADYPELSFRLLFPPETRLFRDGAAIECFVPGESPVKGLLLSLDGLQGELRLLAPDFPDWIEEDSLGIKLAPDSRTTEIMKLALRKIPEDKKLSRLFDLLHADRNPADSFKQTIRPEGSGYLESHLNPSQLAAVEAICNNEELCLVHGPPGTGKTTTLGEAITRLVQRGEKILLSAPSNTAVDHIARGLLSKGIRLLRVGNMSKTDETVYAHTPEGRLNNSKAQKEIRQLRIRAEEFRRMALKYKRNFGAAEREQRNLLFKEVKSIREQIRRLQNYEEEKLFEEAQVIAGTPVGIYDIRPDRFQFHSLLIDEAGQCIEPLAWTLFPFAEKIVLAGDHWQLPPTVLSTEAAALGFNQSILEQAIGKTGDVYLLNTQYRMRENLAGFSSLYFYEGLLKTAELLRRQSGQLVFIDTAGTGYEEEQGPDMQSLQNPGELRLISQLIEQESLEPSATAIISPYAGQVTAAREIFPPALRISTVDSFQGQEKENIIISLVRSNPDLIIGFLKDYRRMNVAITRARERLFLVGDSATLGSDPFFSRLLTYIEQEGNYRTAWEFTV